MAVTPTSKLRFWNPDNTAEWAVPADSGLFAIENTAFVDTTNGDDSTGAVGQLTKPFATAAAAESAASSGDTIVFRPGTHTASGLGKDEVTYYIEPGATLSDDGSNLFTTQSTAISFNVICLGKISMSSNASAIRVDNANAKVVYTGTTIERLSGAFGYNLYGTAGQLIANITDQNATVNDGVFVRSEGGRIVVNMQNVTTSQNFVQVDNASALVIVNCQYLNVPSTGSADYIFNAQGNGGRIIINCAYSTYNNLQASSAYFLVSAGQIEFNGVLESTSFTHTVNITGTGTLILRNGKIVQKENSTNTELILINSANATLIAENVKLVNENTTSGAHIIDALIFSSAGVANIQLRDVELEINETAVTAGAKAINGANVNYKMINCVTNAPIEGINIAEYTQGTPEYDNGNSSTALTINLLKSNTHLVTLTGNCTFTLSNPQAGYTYVLRLVQDGTGSHTVTWPANVKWEGGTAPTLSTAANSIDLITLYYDGTDFYGISNLNFQ